MKSSGASCPTATAVNPDALLSVDRLRVTSITAGRQKILVHDVGFDIEAGQTLGIVGESGSGKSLTARAVIGLLPGGLHADGDAKLSGVELLTASERERRRVRGARIALLMQDPFTMLNPLATVSSQIAESLQRSGRQKRAVIQSEVERRLAEVGLSADVGPRYPFQLSGGMRQRVGLAAALARDPELLIADEPTTALDVTTQDEILKLIKRIQESRGMALILITHDLNLAFSVCDNIQVMYAGTIVERAPARELRKSPCHPYSSALLAAELPVSDYVARIESIPGRVPPADEVLDRCSFADRCEWCQDRCTEARPELSVVGPGRWSACLRSRELADALNPETRDELILGETPLPAQDGSQMLSVKGLRKTFHTSGLMGRRREVSALDGVDLEVFEGESVGLVGETGSGKSTVGRCILGLTRADGGEISVGGTDVSNYGSLRRDALRRVRSDVQAVFQDPYASLNPSMTVEATLGEAIELRGAGAATAADVEQLLQGVGLPTSYSVRRPSTLSGGERQRVAIARALAMHPRLLICDEPVASLDVSAQAQILELLRKVRRESNMSMLFITHDLSVVRQMSERLVVLYRGKVVEMGRTAVVLENPTHPYTQRLLAAVPASTIDLD